MVMRTLIMYVIIYSVQRWIVWGINVSVDWCFSGLALQCVDCNSFSNTDCDQHPLKYTIDCPVNATSCRKMEQESKYDPRPPPVKLWICMYVCQFWNYYWFCTISTDQSNLVQIKSFKYIKIAVKVLNKSALFILALTILLTVIIMIRFEADFSSKYKFQNQE